MDLHLTLQANYEGIVPERAMGQMFLPIFFAALVVLICIVLPLFVRHRIRVCAQSSCPMSPQRCNFLRTLSMALPFFLLTLLLDYYRYLYYADGALSETIRRILDCFYILSIGSIVYALLPLIVTMIGRGMNRFGGRQTHSLTGLMLFIMRMVLILLLLAAVLQVWRINFTGLITGLGIGSVAIALSAQNLLSNLIGGLTIMLDHPFLKGDYISTANISGTVEEIGWRSTRLRTTDQELVTMPNAKLMDANIINVSRQHKRRILLAFDLRADESEDAIRDFLKLAGERIKQRPLYRSQEGVQCYIESGTCALYRVRIYYYITDTDYAVYIKERSEALLSVCELARENGLKFPQLLESKMAGDLTS